MSSLRQLYQDTILMHSRSPKNFCRLEGYTHMKVGHNPLCGDMYQLFAKIEGNVLKEIGFYGEGCAISKASASIMSEQIKGRDLSEVVRLKDAFLEMLLAKNQSEAEQVELPAKLRVFSGVREFPMRIKCATLIWRTLESVVAPSDPGCQPV